MLIPVIRNNASNWLYNTINELFGECVPAAMNTAPAVNVKESDTAYVMDIAAPGLKREDCSVNINDEGNLVVKIESKRETAQGDENQEEPKVRFIRREFSSAKCERTYALPDSVDKDAISAKVSDGILTITMPKVPEESAQKLDRPIEIG